MMTTFLEYRCSRCGANSAQVAPQTFSTCCTAPLQSFYDLEAARSRLPAPGSSGSGLRGVWRYQAILPLPDGKDPVTLGEGATPLLSAPRLSRHLGGNLLIKDESANPTGSFKDRGLTVAVSLAHAAEAPGIVLPTAGNAGASAAAYAARAGLPVSIHAPENTPEEILTEIRLRGAELTLHPGSIADAGKAAAAEAEARGFHTVATFREPGRVEGKKTMAYEVFEQLGRVPDVIVYPCGGGTGIVGMAQAFDEMQELGWIGDERPRLWAIQSAGCAPIVRAFERGDEQASPWEDPVTFAAGLRVPAAFADRLILDALRRTGGGALALEDTEIAEAGPMLAGGDGLLPCPEGAAAVAGAARLLSRGDVSSGETVVIFQTGSALKYLQAWTDALSGV